MGVKDREAGMRERVGMTTQQRYVHSINRDRDKSPVGDFYKTPPQGTSRLLAVERFKGLISLSTFPMAPSPHARSQTVGRI